MVFDLWSVPFDTVHDPGIPDPKPQYTPTAICEPRLDRPSCESLNPIAIAETLN